MPFVEKFGHIVSLVKMQHAIFALPFALASLLMATNGQPTLLLTLQIVLAVILARNVAMAFNRLVDARFDAMNPRTMNRELPSGLLSKQFVLFFTLLNALAFIAVAGWINKICLMLSIPTLLILCFYSLSKRFFSATQIFLGISLGLAPLASWIAATGTISTTAVFLSLAVLFWVAGFDLIYSTLDFEFDKENKLKNLVVRLGVAKSLWLARFFHVLAACFLVLTGMAGNHGSIYYVGVALQVVVLTYEHSIIRHDDLSKVNTAFFTLNGMVSLLYLLAICLEYAI